MIDRRLAILAGILAVLTLPDTAAAASVSVDASVEPGVVNVGGTTTLELRASVQGNTQIQLVQKPDVGSAFDILGTSRRPQLVVRNGRAQRSLTVRYRLRATKKGNFELAPGAVEVGGETYSPDPQKVRVVSSGTRSRDDRSKDGDSSGARARSRDGNILLDASVEPTAKPYLGQQLTVVYALLVNPHQGNVQPRPPDEPSLDNFWIEELSRDMAGNTDMTRIDGRLMEKTILRAYALFPLESGEITIDPLSVKVRTGGFFTRSSTLDLETDPITLNVRSLPPDPPENFYEGNVGDWSFRVDVQQDDAAVGDSITVEMTASGSGNLRRLQLPPLEDRLDGFHVANRSEEVDKNIRGTRISGRKTVTYTLIPTREGDLTVPSLTFAYFNPDTSDYETVESRSRDIVVRGGALPKGLRSDDSGGGDDSAAGDDKDTAEALREQLRSPIRDPDAVDATASRTERIALYVAAGLPVGGLVILLVVVPLAGRLRGSDASRRRRAAVADARDRLEEAYDLSDDEAVDAVYAALRLALVEGLGLPAGALSPGELGDHLRRADCPEPLCERLTAILQWCEDNRYAPSFELDAEEVDEWVAEARDALGELERARKSGELSSLASVGLAILAVSLSSLGAPAPAAAEEAPETADTFEAALQAHDDGKWSTAVDRWKTLVDRSPGDPVLLHNYALDLVQADRLGEARVALERAALAAPHHDAIAANLQTLRRLITVRRIERSRGMQSAPATERGLGWWRAATSVSTRRLAIGLVAALWLLFFGLLGRRTATGDRLRSASTAAVALGLVGVLVAATAWTARWQIRNTTDVAVVTATTTARQAPSEHATARDLSPTLVDGTMLRVRQRRDGWIRFRTPNGRNAWLPESAVTPLQARNR